MSWKPCTAAAAPVCLGCQSKWLKPVHIDKGDNPSGGGGGIVTVVVVVVVGGACGGWTAAAEGTTM